MAERFIQKYISPHEYPRPSVFCHLPPPFVWYRDWWLKYDIFFILDNEECEMQKTDYWLIKSPRQNLNFQRHLILWQFHVSFHWAIYRGHHSTITGWSRQMCKQNKGTSWQSFVKRFANRWSYRCFCDRGHVATIRPNSGWTVHAKWVLLSQIHSAIFMYPRECSS